MSITSSVILWDQAQVDGRRYIRERHTDHLGVHHFVDYLAAAADNVASAMAARVASIEAGLADREMARNLSAIYQEGPLAAVTTNHITLSDARAALREVYRTATREQSFAVGAFLNTLTNNQLGSLFGVSGQQLTALRSRLQTKATQWADYIAAAGE